MDCGLLCGKRDRLRQVMADIPSDVLSKFDKSFKIEYTYNSTAIEGNTLTLIQTKAILEDGLSVGGKLLRVIYLYLYNLSQFGTVDIVPNEKRSLGKGTKK